METAEKTDTIREAVGVFKTVENFQHAIDELESSGFDRAELSVLAFEETFDEKLGDRYSKIEKFEDDPEAPRRPYTSEAAIGNAKGVLTGVPAYIAGVATVGVVVASGGTAAAALAGAALAGGAGGAAGALLAKTLGDREREILEKQLEQGGLLLWVRTRTKEHEKRATDILGKNSAEDVHVHSFPARA